MICTSRNRSGDWSGIRQQYVLCHADAVDGRRGIKLAEQGIPLALPETSSSFARASYHLTYCPSDDLAGLHTESSKIGEDHSSGAVTAGDWNGRDAGAENALSYWRHYALC